MYIAIKYIGKEYTPGEILPDNLPADEVKWLMEAGAIREVAPAPGQPAAPEETGKEPEAAKEPDGEQEPENTEEEPEDEIDEEVEAPEIDVMDGIVADEGPEPEKPAARKKQRERRKTE